MSIRSPGATSSSAAGRAASPDQPNGRGRRPLRDDHALKLMALLLEVAEDRGEPLSARAVARQVSALLGVAGASQSAVADRLRKKQRAQRAADSSFASQPAALERNKSQAVKGKSVHQGLEGDAMQTVSAIETCEAPRRAPKATARVVTWVEDRSRGALKLVSLRVNVSGGSTELCIHPSVAADVLDALQRLAKQHSQLFVPSPSKEADDGE